MAHISRRAVVGMLGALPAGLLIDHRAWVPQARAAASGVLATAEFGPTGAHWPTRTPRPTDAFDVTVSCACSWAEIGAAIASASAQAPGGNVRVVVAPGTLPGNGAGSTKTPVLQNLGRTGRARRVLVMPRDGVGSVTLSNSIRIDRVFGVSFVGFWTFPWSLVLTGVADLAWAWSKGRAFNITANGSGAVSDVELVECVTSESQRAETDVWAFRTDGNPLSRVSVVGSYLAPYFKPAGSPSHLDTLQLSGTHAQNGLTIKDSVIFGSTNAAFIPTSLAAGVVFDHSLVVAGSRTVERYPLPAGSNQFTSGWPLAANGTGTRGIMSAQNSTLIGGVPGTWNSVVDSRTSSGTTSALSGGFTYDPSLATVTASWLEARTPTPTDDRLRAIWKP